VISQPSFRYHDTSETQRRRNTLARMMIRVARSLSTKISRAESPTRYKSAKQESPRLKAPPLLTEEQPNLKNSSRFSIQTHQEVGV
jgi:hypothetical protein